MLMSTFYLGENGDFEIMWLNWLHQALRSKHFAEFYKLLKELAEWQEGLHSHELSSVASRKLS